MSSHINANASGAWAAREGEAVTVVDVKPNGLATGVLLNGAKRTAYIPTRWIDGEPVRVGEVAIAPEDLERRTK